MSIALAVLFGLIAFGLIIAGSYMNERGKTEGERRAALFCVIMGGGGFSVLAIILAVMAISSQI